MLPLVVHVTDEIPNLYLPAHTVLCLIDQCLQYLGKHSQKEFAKDLVKI